MIIAEKDHEARIIRGFLYYLFRECNLYWHTDSDIDHDKKEYGNYVKLRKFLVREGFILDDEHYDLSRELYKFSDFYANVPYHSKYYNDPQRNANFEKAFDKVMSYYDDFPEDVKAEIDEDLSEFEL